MKDESILEQHFEANRARLLAVAYRMLGSRSEAEDATQEAWLRLSGSNHQEIANFRGWLTTVVARICLDMLRSRKSRREAPMKVEAPEILAVSDGRMSAEDEMAMADSVGVAMLIELDTLGAAERLAFVLHDMFAVPFDEIAAIIDRSPEATANWRAARAGGCRVCRRPTISIATGNARWWKPSWRLHAAAISRLCLPCWTRT